MVYAKKSKRVKNNKYNKTRKNGLVKSRSAKKRVQKTKK